jgi:hypothetical protein
LEEFKDAAGLLYKINKRILMLDSHLKETQEVVHKNMRMGIGITGYLQASDEQKRWLNTVYLYLRKVDERYSKKWGFPTSIKLTTVKPSGTLSLLPGVTPGAHPGYAQFMYRRITIATEHPLTQLCRDKGYPVEFKKNIDGSEDYGSCIVTFPFRYPDGTVLAEHMTALKQLETVKDLQTNWSDNSVSCTIYYRIEELPEIRKYLERSYASCHKSLSFLLHSDHGFEQAPYEEITEQQYNDLVAKVQPITDIGAADFEAVDECAGGMCPVK